MASTPLLQPSLFEDDADETRDLASAAATGPPAWRRGVTEHLALNRPHGHACATCCAYALGYDLAWPHPDTA